MKTIDKLLGTISIILFSSLMLRADNPNFNITNKNGVVFQVTVGPLASPLKKDLYKEIAAVDEFKNDDEYWYFFGNFRNYNEATVMENTLKFYEIDGCHIQAFFNRKPIDIKDALTLLDNQNQYDERYIMSESIPVSDLDKMINARIRGARLYYALKVSIYSFQDVDKLMNVLSDMNITHDEMNKCESYNIGLFDKMEDARTARKQFLDAGLQNVYIAAYIDNERISFFEAEKLERNREESFAQELGF